MNNDICNICGIYAVLAGRRCCQKCNSKRSTIRNNQRKSQGLCPDCGLERDSEKTLCNSCSSSRLFRQAVSYHRRKQYLVDTLGGKCADCGLTSKDGSIFDFHHIDPSVKEFGIAQLLLNNFERCKEEVKKCELLCSNCHRLRHHNEDLERLISRFLHYHPAAVEDPYNYKVKSGRPRITDLPKAA